jgi:putative ABC transport system ATP-binding protein
LRDVTLDVSAGEFVVVQGPSGSGKSTLLNICGLLDTPDRGHYRLGGEDVGTLASAQLTRRRRTLIGFVFQGFHLVPTLTAYENVEYPLLLEAARSGERRQRVTDMLGRVGLAEFLAHRPDQLSGGQRQRVAVARALVKRPRLVIADEPTANLDTAAARQVIDLMHDLGCETRATVLIATHDPRISERCDRVVTLADGVLQ